MAFNNKQKIITVAVVLVGLCVFLYVYLNLNENSDVLKTQVSEEEIIGGRVEDVIGDGDGVDSGSVESGKQRYTNTKYNFSFVYPKGFTIGSFKEGVDGEIVLVQDEKKQQGFQVYIIPFDESGPLTLSRIKQDLPDLQIENPQIVVIAGSSIEALLFESQSDSYDKSREIWFIYGGFMYQVTTRADGDTLIGPVMESWRFE